MSTKAKIFPWVLPVLTLVVGLALGCGAATTPKEESPCARDCANGFVACIERCGDDGACRDECMVERAGCAQDCPPGEAPAADAGALPG